MKGRAHGPLPPGPRAPASVNTARLIQRPLQSLIGWRERYGDVFTVPLLVFGTGVYVSDPDAIRAMLTGDQSDLHAGEANAPLEPVLGSRSVLILDGREHLRQRRLLLPPFQGSAVQSFRTVIRDVAEAELAGWKVGDRFAVRDRMRALTFEVIVRAVFGVTERERIDRLRDELMTLLLAGHETTATSLAFAFDLLPRNPRVLARLRDELDGGDDAYLDAVVSETLRLRPVIDAAERTLTEPRAIAGWELPTGIRVYPAIAVVHHRADLYPQPDEFRPERFLDEQAESYAWLPFGGGIRRCIGAALAQAEMAEVIRTVVSRVDLRPTRPEPDPVVIRGVTLVPRHGTPVEVQRVARARVAAASATTRQGL